MSKKILSFAQEQQKTKPKIEDIIGDMLEGDRLKNALDFIAYLREIKMNPRWNATNAWQINYKGKFFCSIRVHGIKQSGIHYGLEPGSWHFGRNWYSFNIDEDFSGEFDNSESYEKFKEFIWSNVQPCKSQMGCMNGSPCGHRCRTYLGKNFDEVCGLRIENPNAEALEHTKKLIECCKKAIDGNINKPT